VSLPHRFWILRQVEDTMSRPTQPFAMDSILLGGTARGVAIPAP